MRKRMMDFLQSEVRVHPSSGTLVDDGMISMHDEWLPKFLNISQEEFERSKRAIIEAGFLEESEGEFFVSDKWAEILPSDSRCGPYWFLTHPTFCSLSPGGQGLARILQSRLQFEKHNDVPLDGGQIILRSSTIEKELCLLPEHVALVSKEVHESGIFRKHTGPYWKLSRQFMKPPVEPDPDEF